MVNVNDLFVIEKAKSRGFETYKTGDIPFITNGEYEYAILGKVKPFPKDKVFTEPAICLSAFCEASVPNIPFLPRGNGGSGLLVLIPKNKMSKEALYFYASQLNLLQWKFSYSRMLTTTRVENLKLVEYLGSAIKIDNRIKELLPNEREREKIKENKNLKFYKIDEICTFKKLKALPQNVLIRKKTIKEKTPYVTTSSFNNGVSEFFDELPNSKGKCLTVALNGSVGEVFFQIDDFITSGDNAVLNLITTYNPYLLLYIGFLIKTHKWRYNYYRKLGIEKLKKIILPLPMKDNKIDIDYIEKIVKNSYGYEEIKKYL